MVFFLSDRIYWIYWIFFSFSQFPEETEKEESRYAGEIKNRVVHFLWSGIMPISGLTPEPTKIMFTRHTSGGLILSNTLRKIT